MKEEELNRKAEEYASEKCKECYMCNSVENGERGYCPKYESRIEGYITGATETTKELQEEITTLKHNRKTVAHLSSCISDVQEKKIAELELEIKKLTQHLEPQLMTDLLKQVREEVEQEQRIKKLEAQIEGKENEFKYFSRSFKIKIAKQKAMLEQLTFLHNEDVNTIKLLNEQIRELKETCNCSQELVTYYKRILGVDNSKVEGE